MTSTPNARPSSSFLTVSEAARMVKEIEAMRGDDEAAHAAEDALVKRALQDIANGTAWPQSLAMTVFQTYSIDFTRWCA